MSWRRESKRDDDRRTNLLLDALDHAYAVRTGDPCSDAGLTEFEETVLHGVGYDPARPYPPAGHRYPRKG
ncbi:hypothetical protein ACFY2W_36260 [Streptomyces sp. NPDC001262]|uniref:hypothetical protein n=1 Tax=Streptomyces sp. NPDC001262 TaxID=3364552 RepID=UPI0036A4A3B8